ncbi:hypothetical protein GCM10007973_28010 [Polymorphobacter multimanifer]|uniref:Putative membrane protein n=1 Tax=Polymorphobacter multimanifer TaxID=1070431 RepID=A0A841L6F4_9SPHN|nr:DUF2306 domain-containing protein [Polymorphobacter multimanifer]MBB6228184.1 putative membrane protein [Polymorphobacter multimanifer]GGI90044.1 hypothetical protein GCM10007973_28010 [Polymorphobacter multimanifer]
MFANLSPLILAHLVASSIALPLGLHQLTIGQGTPRHALLGRIYIIAMLLALLTALATFRPGTPFLPFYILAFVGLYSLIAGTVALRRWLRRREPKHLRAHKINMAFSWLGLAMAGVSQISSNPRFGIVQGLDPVGFWVWLILLNLCLYGIGSWWIFARLVRDGSAPRR